jgi:two-component system nitrate/nitrite response regulator NarL
MQKQIKVMLVEDNPAYRRSIAYALNGREGIQLTHEFGTAEIALQSLRALKKDDVPDLILLDLCLPGMSGLEALPSFGQSLPNTKIIILTQSDKEADIMEAISHGAAGYLLKKCTVNEVRNGIQSVMRGGASLDEKVAKLILEKMQNAPPKKHIAEQGLSEREMEILILLADGLVKKEIGDRLSISPHTVNNHIRHIYEKLNVANAPAAINKAHKTGLFSHLD